MAAAHRKSRYRTLQTSRIRLGRGFTIIEIVIVVAILGLLAVIAGTNYLSYIERVRVASAVASIRTIAMQLDDYVRSGAPLPAELSEIGEGDRLDPWGHPFEYLPFPTTSPGSGRAGSGDSGSGNSGSGPIAGSYLGSARKDHFLVPLNTDYDLYSVGKDGKSRPPLSAPDSADDVIRANDGAYMGLAANY